MKRQRRQGEECESQGSSTAFSTFLFHELLQHPSEEFPPLPNLVQSGISKCAKTSLFHLNTLSCGLVS